MTTATQNAGSITVYTGGLSPTVTITLNGDTATLFSDQACITSQANPFTPTEDTTVYVTNSGQYVVSATVNGVELVGDGGIFVQNGDSGNPGVRCAADPAALAQALSAGGGSSQFVTLPISITDDGTGWDIADATGTWVFNGDGTVSQTANDPLANVDTSIYTAADVFALDWDVSVDIRLDDTTSDDSAMECGIFADYPAVTNSGVNGSGIYSPHQVDAPPSGNGTLTPVRYTAQGSTTPRIAAAIGGWHTYRFVTNGPVVALFFDDTPQGVFPLDLHSVAQPVLTSRVALYNYGKATFRNLSVKYVPAAA